MTVFKLQISILQIIRPVQTVVKNRRTGFLLGLMVFIAWILVGNFGLPSVAPAVQNEEGLSATLSKKTARVGDVVWYQNSTVDIDEDNVSVPRSFSLKQNYPNPFNASTSIEYVLPEQTNVTIAIYDILGRNVLTLLEENQWAGYHSVTWNAHDFSSGIYFYRLQADDYIESRRMLLLK